MPFKRFEADSVGSLDDMISNLEDQLEAGGLKGANEEPETIVVLRNNATTPDGIRDWSCIAYNGATMAEVISDLKSRETP